MKDKIYLKTSYDGIWEKNSTLGYVLYLSIYIIILFSSIFVFTFLNVPTVILIIWLVFILIYLIVKSILVNQSRNMSKSTAFIERDGVLYAIQLLYTKKKLSTETSKSMIYAPSGSVLQAATLENNFKVAKDTQAHEKEVRNRRNNPLSFLIALDDILNYLEQHPKDYKVLPNNKRSKLDNLFMYDRENSGLTTIVTKNAYYNFLILNNPKIVKENEKYFTISFYNQNNELCTVKFSNCFDKLIEHIKNS